MNKLFDVFLLYGIYCITFSCLTALPMISSSTLSKNGESGCPILDTGFRRNAFSFFFISNKFGCRFLIHSLYCVKYIPSSSVLSRHFIRKGYWILITVFFISIYLIMWFLMSSLFVYHKYISDTCIELSSLQMPEVLIYCSISRVY